MDKPEREKRAGRDVMLPQCVTCSNELTCLIYNRKKKAWVDVAYSALNTPKWYACCSKCHDEAVSENNAAHEEQVEELTEQIEALQERLQFLQKWGADPNKDPHADVICHSKEGDKLQAHRCVLASKSAVYKTMLGADLKEGRTGDIYLKDMSTAVLRPFLRFFYTAEVTCNDLKLHAADLIAAAHKYEVEELKSVCEKFICKNMSSENALGFMELAILYSCDTLKSAAMTMISGDWKTVVSSKEYKSFCERDARAVIEMYQGLVPFFKRQHVD